MVRFLDVYFQVLTGDHLYQGNLLGDDTITTVVNYVEDTLINSKATVGQRSRKVPIPGTLYTGVLGDRSVAILGPEGLVKTFSLQHWCTNTSEINVLQGALLISCENDLVIIFPEDGTYKLQSNSYPSKPVLITHQGTFYIIYKTNTAIIRQNLKLGEKTILYTTNDVPVNCLGWSLSSYNQTHFMLECHNKRRCLISAIQSATYNCNGIPVGDGLTVFRDLDKAVLLTENNFTFYQNGFQSNCTIPLEKSFVRTDYAIYDDHMLLVFFSEESIYIYNTTGGCNDTYLTNIANGSYLCVDGSCDGYYISDEGYLLVISNSSGMYQLQFHNLLCCNNDTTNLWDFSRRPYALNVIKLPSIEPSSSSISSTLEPPSPITSSSLEPPSPITSSSLGPPSPITSSSLGPPSPITSSSLKPLSNITATVISSTKSVHSPTTRPSIHSSPTNYPSPSTTSSQFIIHSSLSTIQHTSLSIPAALPEVYIILILIAAVTVILLVVVFIITFCICICYRKSRKKLNMISFCSEPPTEGSSTRSSQADLQRQHDGYPMVATQASQVYQCTDSLVIGKDHHDKTITTELSTYCSAPPADVDNPTTYR